MKMLYFNNKYFPEAKCGVSYADNFPFGHEFAYAVESESNFFAFPINTSGNIHFLLNPTITLEEWVKNSFGDSNPAYRDPVYISGTYYKRMKRACALGGINRDVSFDSKVQSSLLAIKILVNKLENLFETIEPDNINIKVYGQKIREVLLLASMEVESSWTAVLKENEYTCKGKFLTTSDYFKLKKAMFLGGYNVSLLLYPEFPEFKPFFDWEEGSPTQSLIWYDAYNKTKHDREENIKFGTLENAVYAVGAAIVMFDAQFGMSYSKNILDQINSSWGSLFKVDKKHLKNHEIDFYVPVITVSDNSIYPIFTNPWTPVNYPFN